MEIVVTGVGLISALGDLGSTWNSLLQGQSGLQSFALFPALAAKPVGLVGSSPTELAVLTERVVTAALTDAALAPPLPNCGVVVGSSRGNQAQWEKLVSYSLTGAEELPLPWLDTLPHAAAIVTARQIQTRGAVFSPMAACATGLWAIAQGCELLHSGQVQQVVAGAVEAPITPLTLTGFDRMGALATTGAYPFDQRREGLVLGEGGAMLVLEPAELAKQRGAKIYGRIRGYGLTADGHHVSAPEPSSRSAIAAVNQCLKQARLTPQDIDFIHTHGTATQLNDRNEANLIQQLFPSSVAICSTKGATGHTIGASGALGAVFSLLALQNQLLPPCVGLQEPAFALNFVRVAQLINVHHALCLSFGFGGQNAAVVFSRD